MIDQHVKSPHWDHCAICLYPWPCRRALAELAVANAAREAAEEERDTYVRAYERLGAEYAAQLSERDQQIAALREAGDALFEAAGAALSLLEDRGEWEDLMSAVSAYEEAREKLRATGRAVNCETCRVYLHCPTHPDALKCACGRAATLIVRYVPRPAHLFGGAVTGAVCPACYSALSTSVRILSQQHIPTPD